MNEKSKEIALKMVPEIYLIMGYDSIKNREKKIMKLFTNNSLPEEGMDEGTIEYRLKLFQILIKIFINDGYK